MTDKIVIQFSTAAPVGWAVWFPFLDFSMWIRRATHCPFSHADLVLPDNTLLGSSDNPTAPVIFGNPRGVAIRPGNYQDFRIRRRITIPAEDVVVKAFYDFCFAQIGKPFDHAAMKMRYFLSDRFDDRDWRDDGKWFCAEMLGRAAEVSKLFPWKLVGVKNRLTGSDLLLILNPLYDVDAFWRPAPGLTLGPWET